MAMGPLSALLSLLSSPLPTPAAVLPPRLSYSPGRPCWPATELARLGPGELAAQPARRAGALLQASAAGDASYSFIAGQRGWPGKLQLHRGLARLPG
ncbi:hypothetical protein PVAP13_3KG239827 [Panicum virgatum]|uniref:Uncharacterized protein n=1 Tax=Panicum virgatum TaxID=38727 RepID=A0A8T0V7A2_PANVG|nr:hypothetical protein PVAP13_3KG239827 [Panicum virgatum]